VLTVVALFFGGRALILFRILTSTPQNFLPAAKRPGGCTNYPAQTVFNGETEQILIILACLIVTALARMLWRKSMPSPMAKACQSTGIKDATRWSSGR
jgi:hypothetical protein